MPDIITVSEDLQRLNVKTRALSETVDISESVDTVIAKSVSKGLTETVEITEDTATLRAKTRLISETTTVSEELKVYKNGVELVPAPPPAPPTGNLIGTRERAVRMPRRAPRAIVIDEVSNVAIAPLKLLAFSDSINKAIVGIQTEPRLIQNVARVSLSVEKGNMSLAQCCIKTSLQPMTVKAKLALLSSPLIGLGEARLKTRPEVQYIESLKAINFEKMYKLHRIIKLAMLAETL
jgi:hypothetical protein